MTLEYAVLIERLTESDGDGYLAKLAKESRRSEPPRVRHPRLFSAA